ncbi:MAG: glycerophosphodiester phosphodiesterase family protein [Bacteroidota bacterium]
MRFIKHFILLSLFSVFSCEQQEKAANREGVLQEEETDKMEEFDWQGHRGARGLIPENTVAGFTHALEFPAITTLELDLVVSKDNFLVVSHEPWMSAAICMDKAGKPISEDQEKAYNIYEMKYIDIAKFDCGIKGNERFPEQKKISVFKPQLSDVVDAVEHQIKNKKRSPIRYNMEIKSSPAGDRIFHPIPEKFAALLVEEISRLGIKERTTIQSFDVRALQATKKLDAAISLALLIENEKSLAENLALLGFTPSIYSPYHRLVDADLVAQAAEKSMQVIPWTVNEVERMKELIALGVDGIITDYPNRIARIK